MADDRLKRRLAAIVAVDVVGYSRMMAADEAGTHARLRSLRYEVFEPITALYSGRIFKNTGDGAHIVEGAEVRIEVGVLPPSCGLTRTTASERRDN